MVAGRSAEYKAEYSSPNFRVVLLSTVLNPNEPFWTVLNSTTLKVAVNIEILYTPTFRVVLLSTVLNHNQQHYSKSSCINIEILHTPTFRVVLLSTIVNHTQQYYPKSSCIYKEILYTPTFRVVLLWTVLTFSMTTNSCHQKVNKFCTSVVCLYSNGCCYHFFVDHYFLSLEGQ